VTLEMGSEVVVTFFKADPPTLEAERLSLRIF
jgi:hypothetical protein